MLLQACGFLLLFALPVFWKVAQREGRSGWTAVACLLPGVSLFVLARRTLAEAPLTSAVRRLASEPETLDTARSNVACA